MVTTGCIVDVVDLDGHAKLYIARGFTTCSWSKGSCTGSAKQHLHTYPSGLPWREDMDSATQFRASILHGGIVVIQSLQQSWVSRCCRS